TDFSFPIRPDFILTTERDVFRPGQNGSNWEAFGDWNDRCAREHRELFSSASPVLAEVVDFVNQRTEARVLYNEDHPEGLIANSEEEKFAAMPSCPVNAIAEVKTAVRAADGYVAESAHGAGVYEALMHFASR